MEREIPAMGIVENYYLEEHRVGPGGTTVYYDLIPVYSK